MILDVSPTRMELLRLKRKIAIARKGHKLLKDKLDELVRIMLDVVREIGRLRSEIDRAMAESRKMMALARHAHFPEAATGALAYSQASLEIEVRYRQVLNLQVPRYSMGGWGYASAAYGIAHTSAALDRAVSLFMDVMDRLVELAEKEKTVQLMAEEIQKTRRRVNALEYILIPNIEDTLKYISMKLEEQERNTQTQLMRIKDVVRAPLAPTTAFPGAAKMPV